MNNQNILPPRKPKQSKSRRKPGKPKGGIRMPLEQAMELMKQRREAPPVVEEKPQRRLICEG